LLNNCFTTGNYRAINIFVNPKIPGFGRRQSRDSGLRKSAWIPWLQTLLQTFPFVFAAFVKYAR